jgi:hypothetical protein
MTRSILVVLIVLLGACASGPRERDRPPSLLPPPRLEEQDLYSLAHQAGESLAATTTLTTSLGKGPLGISTFANLIPWRELRQVEKEPVRTGFQGGSTISTIGHVATWSLAVDALAFVHRASEGSVNVEYSLDFLLIDPEGGNPWTAVVTHTVHGGKGEVDTQALMLRDLDRQAEQAAIAISGWLKDLRVHAVHVFAHAREPAMAPTVGFEDRLRRALVAHGVTLAGKCNYVVELDVSQDGIQRETGAEKWRFLAELFQGGKPFPDQRWEQYVTRSSGD